MARETVVSQNHDVLNPNSLSFDERLKQLEAEEAARKKQAEKAKNSPYNNWYQFNREYSKEMIWLAGTYPKAHQILLFLLDQMNDYNAVMCSHVVLQEALGMSKSTVIRSVKVLKEHGFITIYKSGTANVYAVNKSLAWGSWGTNYKYAKFDAKIIISETEQEVELSAEKQKIVTTKKKS